MAILSKLIKNKDDKKPKFSKMDILSDIKISELIEQPETVDLNTSITEILKILKNNECVFISENNKITGAIYSQTLLNKINDIENLKNLKADRIKEEIVKINKDDNISKAILIMNMKKIDCLAVYDKNKFIGILRREKIIEKLSEKLTEKETSDIIETDIDKLIDLIQKGISDIDTLSKELKVDKELVEEWLSILEEHNKIKIIKKSFNKSSIEYVG